MEPSEFVPTNKFDSEAASRAVAAGWPEIEPVTAELLNWIKDYNWPVARTLLPLFSSIGEPLAPYLSPILDGGDDIWKLNVIQNLLTGCSPELVRHLASTLNRIADSPTPGEVEEEVDAAAKAALGRQDR